MYYDYSYFIQKLDKILFSVIQSKENHLGAQFKKVLIGVNEAFTHKTEKHVLKCIPIER